jgi:gliding motility-associated-like protein
MKTCLITLITTVEVPAISDIAFHPDGTLYGINGSGVIFTIDTLTGDTNFVHKLSGQLFQAMTCSRDGILYISGKDGILWTYNPANDVATLLGNIGFQNNGDLTFFNGDLYVTDVSNDYVIKINLINLGLSEIVITNAGGFGGGIYGIVTYAKDCNDVKLYGVVSGNYTVVELDLETMSNDTICFLNKLYSGAATIEEAKASDPVRITDLVMTPSDCGTSNGSITVTATGGIPPLLYSIQGSNFQSENIFNNLAPGAYTILVSDSHGCNATKDVEIDQIDRLITSIEIVPDTCWLAHGSITVIPFIADHLQYSLDSIVFQDENYFPGLAAGHYRVIARNDFGCIDEIGVDLTALPHVEITGLQITPTTCGQNNGAVTIEAQIGEPLLYTINGLEFQEDNSFYNLEPGTILVSVKDENGCIQDGVVIIEESEGLKLDSIIIRQPTCNDHAGDISFKMENGTGTLAYTLDNSSNQQSPDFFQILPGVHSWIIGDSAGCVLEGNLEINSPELLSIESIQLQRAACNLNNGAITILINEQPGKTIFYLNNQAYDQGIWEDLSPGLYAIQVVNENDCIVDTTLAVLSAPCKLFVPNVFSPNGDGVNESFAVFTSAEENIIITSYLVYDRWGNLVYSAGNFQIADNSFWWNGMSNEKNCESGVYTYFIEAQYEDGSKEPYYGDITLIR